MDTKELALPSPVGISRGGAAPSHSPVVSTKGAGTDAMQGGDVAAAEKALGDATEAVAETEANIMKSKHTVEKAEAVLKGALKGEETRLVKEEQQEAANLIALKTLEQEGDTKVSEDTDLPRPAGGGPGPDHHHQCQGGGQDSRGAL